MLEFDTWEQLIEDDRPVLTPVYRMPERDSVSSPKPMFKTGDMITYSRCVVRVGYEIGVHSVSKAEWFEAGARIVAQRTGQPVEVVRRIITELNIPAPFKGLKHAIYEDNVRPLITQTTPENRNVRAMWLYDYPAIQQGTVLGQIVKLTGRRSSGGYFYDGDYDLPILSSSARQVLYKVQPYDTYRFALVYPADAHAA